MHLLLFADTHVRPCPAPAPRLPACSQLLKHLTVQRPVNANRSDYYVHAEAFAALVAIEIVPPEVRCGAGVAGAAAGAAGT